MDNTELLNKCFTIGEKEFVVRNGLKQFQQIMKLLKDFDLSIYGKIFDEKSDISEDEMIAVIFQLIKTLLEAGVLPELLSFILKPADGKWNEQDAAVVREYFEEDGEVIIPKVLMAFFLSKTNLINEITTASRSLINSTAQ